MWHAAHSQPSTHSAHLSVTPTANQSLAKHNRKPSQMTENKQQQPKSIASFCRVVRDYQAKGARLPLGQTGGSCTRSQILIGSAPVLETDAND